METTKAHQLYREYLGLTEEQDFLANLLGMASFMIWGALDDAEDQKADDDETKTRYYPVDALKAIDAFDTETKVKDAAKHSFFVQIGSYNAEALINITAKTLDEGTNILKSEFPNLSFDSMNEIVEFLKTKITAAESRIDAETNKDSKALVGQALDESGVNLDEFD